MRTINIVKGVLIITLIVFVISQLVFTVGWLMSRREIECDGTSCHAKTVRSKKECVPLETEIFFDDTYDYYNMMVNVDITSLEMVSRFALYSTVRYDTEEEAENDINVVLNETVDCWVPEETMEYKTDYSYLNREKTVYLEYSKEIEDDKVHTYRIWLGFFIFGICVNVGIIIALFSVCLYGFNHQKKRESDITL